MKRAKHNRMINEGLRHRDMKDPNFGRLYYVRYADDFMLGFVGSKADASVIYGKIVEFLDKKLGMKCSSAKTSIVHGTNKVKYLGTLVRWIAPVTVVTSEPGEEVKGKHKVAHNKPELTAPIVDMCNAMVRKGFAVVRKSDKRLVRATSNRGLTLLEVHEIVRRYNSIISGILNYYSFVSHRSVLWKIIDLYRKSCALTIADKLRLRTASKVFYKLGRNLVVKNDVGIEIASLNA